MPVDVPARRLLPLRAASLPLLSKDALKFFEPACPVIGRAL